VPGLIEAALDLVPLRGGEPQRLALTQSSQGTAGDRPDHVEVPQQGIARGDRQRRVLVGGRSTRTEKQQWIVKHQLASLGRPRAIACIQLADLPRAQSLARDRRGELHGVLPLGARQRHHVLHRRMGDQLALQHPLLDLLRQLTDQGQAPADPARAPIESTGQLLEGESEAQVQLLQPQPLLERRLLQAVAHQSAEKHRFDLARVPADGLDPIAPQTPHRPNPLVAVHDDKAIRLLRGNHHDRDLLPVLGQRRQQSSLPVRSPDPQVLVAQDQLVVFEVHRGCRTVRGRPGRSDAVSRPQPGKSEPISCRDNDLHGHCVSRPQVEDFARFLNRHSNLPPHCVSRRRPVNSAQGVDREPRGALRGGTFVRPQTPPEPVLEVVVGMAPPPGRAGPPIPLPLTAGGAAHVLAVSSSRVRQEPLPADPARTLASHAVLQVGQPASKRGAHGTDRVDVGGQERTAILVLSGGSFLASRGGSILTSAEVLVK